MSVGAPPASQLPPLRPYSLSSRHHIDVVDTWQQCEVVMAGKSPESLSVLALDCEWVEGGRGGRCPVALLQLGFMDGQCVLVRLCKTGAVPPTLLAVLQDSK